MKIINARILLLTTFIAAGTFHLDCPAADNNNVPQQPENHVATLNYWADLNQSFCKGNGIEVLGLPANTTGITAGEIARVLRDIAVVERSRCDAAARLPMLHVDSDLTLYASDLVKVRLKIADLLSDMAETYDKQSQITSGAHIGVEFVLNLLSHLGDKEGILWNAAEDQVGQTSREIEQMISVSDSVRSEVNDLAKAVYDFKAQEMQERAILTERYQREFPLLADYVKKALANKPEFALTEAQIRKLILRHSVDLGGIFDRWTFDDNREFVSFQILKMRKLNEATIVCEIQSHVRGINTGQEHDLHLRAVFGRFATRNRLVSISIIPQTSLN